MELLTMNLTNEQIERILVGAPDGATHWDNDYFYLKSEKSGYMSHEPEYDSWDYEYSCLSNTHRLSDLREILELRERVSELQEALGELQRAANRAGLRMIKAGLVSDFEKLDAVLCSFPPKPPKENTNERFS